jgi:hypothetical protein
LKAYLSLRYGGLLADGASLIGEIEAVSSMKTSRMKPLIRVGLVLVYDFDQSTIPDDVTTSNVSSMVLNCQRDLVVQARFFAQGDVRSSESLDAQL